MQKYCLFPIPYLEGRTYFISEEDLERVMYVGHNHMLIQSIEVNEEYDELLERVERLIDSDANEEEDERNIYEKFADITDEQMASYLRRLGYSDVIVSWSPEYLDEEWKDCLLFDADNVRFDDLINLDVSYRYQWHDGNNPVEIITEEDVQTVVVGDDYCLDVWDGQNMSTGGSFEHEHVYQLLEVDDEKVEDAYLLMHYSQWQGTHATAKILSFSELREHLIELGYDDAEYMEKIEKSFSSESQAS